jgi:hypothetical protein
MKKKLITLAFGFIAITALAQSTATTNKIKEVQVNKNASGFIYRLGGNTISLTSDTIVPIKRYLKDYNSLRYTNKDVLYAGNSLNHLFSKKLETNFKTSSDLSLQKMYFNIDPLEKSLSLGVNLDNRFGNPLKKLTWVASAGAKMVNDEGFAAIPLSEDDQESDLGFNLKFTLIGKGVIKWKSNGVSREQKNFVKGNEDVDVAIEDVDAVIKMNRDYLNYTYNKKVKDYNTEELNKIVELIDARYPEASIEFKKEKITKKIKEKSDELLYEMIKEEIEYVEENKLYTSISNHWVTSAVYIPFGNKDYNINPITEKNEPTSVSYLPLNFNISYNYFKQTSSNYSLFFKLQATYKNNNNIEVNGLSEKEFQSITTTNNVTTLTTPVKAIDITQFQKFNTRSLKADFTSFFCKNFVGVSLSLEKNFGDFDRINWKLGIPFSLKDKEGKPTVNFEFQWKENQNFKGSTHLLGLSTSFFFGDLIK